MTVSSAGTLTFSKVQDSLNRMWTSYTHSIEETGLVKNIIKLVGYGAYWTRQAFPSSAPASLDQLNNQMRHVKNAMSAVAVPYKLVKVAEKIEKFRQEPSLQHGSDILGEACKLVNELDDAKGFVEFYLPQGSISPAVSTVLGKVNSSATIISSVKGFVDDFRDIGHAKATFEQNEIKKRAGLISDIQHDKVKTNVINAIPLHMVNLASKIAYFALGIMSLGAILTGAATPVMGIVTCLTIATVLSLFAFFYERVVDPNGKIQRQHLKELDIIVQKALVAESKNPKNDELAPEQREPTVAMKLGDQWYKPEVQKWIKEVRESTASAA